MTTELENRAARGGVWVGGANVLVRGLELARYVAVARLLSPDQLGLFGFAVLSLSVVQRFSDLGIDSAIIALDGDLDRQLSAAFTVQIVRSLVLAALLYVAAPIPAAVFDDPRVIPLVRLIALVPLVDTVANPGLVVLERELRFGRQTLFRVSGVLANVVVAVGLAWTTRSVEALVFGVLAGAVVHTLVSHVIVSHHPLPSLDLEQVRELFAFGKWLTGNSVLSWLSNEGDDVLVGTLVGSAGLAFYRSAYQFGQAPQTELTAVVTRVAFPAFAKVKSDRHALVSGYRRSLALATLAVFPAAVGMTLVAPVFIPTVLGAEWRPAVVPLQAISLAAAAGALTATAGSLWQAVDRPDLVTKTQALTLVTLAALAIPGTLRYGIVGTAAAVTGAAVLVAPVRVALVARTLDSSAREVLRPVVGPLLATVAMSAVVLAVLAAVGTGIVALAAGVLAGVVSYITAVLLLDRTRLATASPVWDLLEQLRS